MPLNDRSHKPQTSHTRAAWLVLAVCMVSLLSACGEKSVAKVSTETDAIEIINVLREYSFDVGKEEVGEGEAVKWSVTVNDGWFTGGEEARATQVLHYYGLPRKEDQSGKDEDGGVFPSPSIENAKRLRERQVDMERKLRMLPGVARVNVTIVLPEDDSIKLDPYPATASVLLVHKEPQPIFTGEQIQNQVAGGVPGLKPEKVTVSMSYEPPPAVPHQDLNQRRHTNRILAIGIGLVAVLCLLLGTLLLQTRRQRAELTALREGEEEFESDTAALTEGEGQGIDSNLLDNGTSSASGARQLSVGTVATVEDSTSAK
jgi:type III secretory pathway lipoprotein EscJ